MAKWFDWIPAFAGMTGGESRGNYCSGDQSLQEKARWKDRTTLEQLWPNSHCRHNELDFQERSALRAKQKGLGKSPKPLCRPGKAQSIMLIVGALA